MIFVRFSGYFGCDSSTEAESYQILFMTLICAERCGGGCGLSINDRLAWRRVQWNGNAKDDEARLTTFAHVLTH